MKPKIMLALMLLSLSRVATAAEPAVADARQLVAMPAAAQAIMRDDMLDHLAALNEVLGYLADGKLDAAAETAETRIGRSAMGRNMGKARGMGPGRFMPDAMRNLGWRMHDVASEFAHVAKGGDKLKAYAALQPVMASCVACHLSFRTR